MERPRVGLAWKMIQHRRAGIRVETLNRFEKGNPIATVATINKLVAALEKAERQAVKGGGPPPKLRGRPAGSVLPAQRQLWFYAPGRQGPCLAADTPATISPLWLKATR